MIDRQTTPLELASRVLEPETIREIKLCPGFDRRAYLILDRWALNEPEALKRLEMSGKSTMRRKTTALVRTFQEKINSRI